MKQLKFYSILLCALLLFPLLSSCATERFDLLYEVEHNGITYCARGTDDRVKQIVVKEDDKAVWSKRVRTDRKMEKIDETYGLSVQDLDFDGYDDVLIAIETEGECITYACYIRDGKKMQYTLRKELSDFCNIKADSDLRAIFAFEQITEARDDNAYLHTDKVTKYVWQNGELVPERYAAIHYYSGGEQKPYCYAVAEYDEDLGRFADSSDKWLTEKEYQDTDWSFFYYFK